MKSLLSIDWLRNFFDKQTDLIGYLRLHRNDVQNKDAVFVTSNPSQSDFDNREVSRITKINLAKICIYYSIRQSVEATWINDRDQFLYPNDGWQNDTEF